MDMSRYKSLFVEEAREHLSALASGLEQAPAGTDGEGIDALFRAAHSIKGMAATMGFDPVARVAHSAEDLLDLVRQKQLELSAEVSHTLLEAVDFLGSQVDAVATDAPLGDPDPVVKALGALTQRGPGTSPVLAEEPAAAPGAVETQQASVETGRLLEVRTRIDRAAKLPAARALVVIREAGHLGQVKATEPNPEELMQGRFDGTLRLRLETLRTPEEVAERLDAITEVEVLGVREASRRGAEPQAGPAEDAAAPSGPAFPQSIRVSTAQMDHLLEAVSELVVGLATLEHDLDSPHDARSRVKRLENLAGGLKRDVLTLRMIPFESITPQLQRTVRDVSRRLGKPVKLALSGTDTRLDRAVLEELVTPLVHLLRNAIDHAIEPASERGAAGKQATGHLHLELQGHGEAVLISVTDDGRGMDGEKLVARALERGLLTPEKAARLSPSERLRLAALPGLSTSSEVSDVSGRGVGLDLVVARVESLGGRLLIDSRPGEGTTMTLRVPLTVATQRALVLRAGEQAFTVPIASVAAVIRLTPDWLEGPRGKRVASIDGELVRVFSLAQHLGLTPDWDPDGPFTVLLYQAAGQRYAMAVDALVGEREVVVQPLGRPLQRMREYMGASVLSEAELALMLDLEGLAPQAEAA